MSESGGKINSENKKLAARQFEYAHRAITAGNDDLAIQMLKMSCKLDPTQLSYRQKLRKVEKKRYKENKRGSIFAHFFCFFKRLAMWRSFRKKEYYSALEQGEAILAWNPWNREVILCMAEAASLLNHSVIAIWLLQDARQDIPNDIQINRLLAQLLEREGYFTQAMHLWELIGKELPNDREAVEKARQMAVSETISRGNYSERADQEILPGLDSSPALKKSEKSTGTLDNLGSSKSEEVNLRAAMESDSADEKAYLQFAKFLRRSGKLEQAREVLHQGLERFPGSSEVTLAAIDYQIESYRLELNNLDQKRLKHPKDESIQQAQRRLSRKIVKGEKLWFTKKMEMEPNDQGLRYELGLRHVTLGEIEEGISCFQAVRKDPRFQSRSLFQLGKCFLAVDNWPLAQRNLEEALKSLAESEIESRKEILDLLAEGFFRVGDVDKAIEFGLELADLDYSYREIGKRLSEWQKKNTPAKPTSESSDNIQIN